jgi:hypothetical protein
MTGLDVFAFVVMGLLLGVGICLAFLVGALPGRIAEQRAHPQAEAIRVAGWIGLLTLGLAWPFALIWAYTRSAHAPADPGLGEEIHRLSDRVAALEADHSPDTATVELES